MAGGKSGYTQETIILNDYNGSTISQRARTSKKSGKTTKRTSFEIKAEPIVHTFDDQALGRGPAEALKGIISEQIKAISASATTKTLQNRTYSQLHFPSQLSKSDKKRYTGGRIGALEPNQPGGKLFNDSGRLADGLAVGKNRQAAGERDWVVNVPANRFTDRSGHPPTVHLAKRLASLVPALGRPSTLRGNPKLQAAVAESIDLLIAKAKSTNDAKRVKLLQARKNALRAVLALARSVTGL